MATRRERVKALQELYAQVPRVACKGLCHDACGPVRPGRLEVELMEARAGGKKHVAKSTAEIMRAGPGQRCCYLSKAGRCTIYGARPMICRIWGAVESMPCHHGCKPEGGRYLTDAEGYRLISMAFEMPEHEVRNVVQAVAGGDLDEYLAGLKPKTVIEMRRAALREVPREH